MDKVHAIRQQKQQLRRKILQLQGQKVPNSQLTQDAITKLYQRKKQIQHQRLQQQNYKKMQQQYNERKKQIQRQKQLQKIRNQKRMIELQVGMKKIVLNSVQQKVKGINSDQLFTRALLRQQQGSQTSQISGIQRSKLDIKNEFQKYLQATQVKKQKVKYNVYQLNQKRFQLFQKKQQLLMREILLKQLLSQQSMPQLDIMSCSKQQLLKMLQQNNIDIQDYIHPLDPRQVAQHYQMIQQSIKENIQQKKKQQQQNDNQQRKIHRIKQDLKEWVAKQDKHVVKFIKELLYIALDQAIYDYQNRHYQLTSQEKKQKMDSLKTQLTKMQMQTLCDDLSKQIVDRIQKQILKQILKQSVQQVCGLHQLCRSTCNMSFDWLYKSQTFISSLSSPFLQKLVLTYQDQSQNIRYGPKKSLYAKQQDFKQQLSNIFQTERFTSELINDIKLLKDQELYFQQVQVQIKRDIDGIQDGHYKLVVQCTGVYTVSGKNIKRIQQQNAESQPSKGRVIVTFNKQIKHIKKVKKLNSTWIIQTSDTTYIYSTWTCQTLPQSIGQRINSPCGPFSCIQINPSFTLLGNICSLTLGFQKGQILKYNLNRNRITNQQTNITYYVPLGISIKTGDEPAFPLNNKNVIQYKTQKVKDTEQIHQFREFFDHHTTEIISVNFYKDNKFITVDKSLKCAIWHYDQRRGPKSYQPLYEFELRSSYVIYKQSQKPRFRDLYPSANMKQSGQQLYKKWMQQQTFLKLQIYNNPKKSNALFKSPKSEQSSNQQAVWKISYTQKQKSISKIYQTYYNVIDGKIQCKQVKLFKEYLVLLVEREHVVRHDLKTVKVYLWNIQSRKLATVAVEFDVFVEQKNVPFNIIQHQVNNIQYTLLTVVSSGKVLLFSLLSGQLLKDVSQQKSCIKVKPYNFLSIQAGFDLNMFAVARKNIVQFYLKNKNSKQKQLQFSKSIQISRKKYSNLI